MHHFRLDVPLMLRHTSATSRAPKSSNAPGMVIFCAQAKLVYGSRLLVAPTTCLMEST